MDPLKMLPQTSLVPVIEPSSTSISTVVGAIAGDTATTTITANQSGGRGSPKTKRGLNKPKCNICGHVARSRCPFSCCKNCCAKAENPCHIHVLKSNAAVSENAQSPSPPLFEQQPPDSSTMTALKGGSFRQLSQFKAAQAPPRPKRPLTKKDAAAINQWRFSKFKEHKDSNIEAENDAFDKYVQNANLLEETLLVGPSLAYPFEDKENYNRGKILSEIMVKLRSNPNRRDSLKKRIKVLVDQGLRNLRKREFSDEEVEADSDLSGSKNHKRLKKDSYLRVDKASVVNELMEKMNIARNEDDLKSCLVMKSQLFNRDGNVVKATKGQVSDYSHPRLFTKVEVNQEDLNNMDLLFSSLDQIEDL